MTGCKAAWAVDTMVRSSGDPIDSPAGAIGFFSGAEAVTGAVGASPADVDGVGLTVMACPACLEQPVPGIMSRGMVRHRRTSVY